MEQNCILNCHWLKLNHNSILKQSQFKFHEQLRKPASVIRRRGRLRKPPTNPRLKQLRQPDRNLHQGPQLELQLQLHYRAPKDK